MAENKNKNVTHEVTRGSISLLISCLSQPGWGKRPVDLFAAGSLLEELDGQFGADVQPESSEDEAGFQSWAIKKVKLELTEKQREAAKAALKYFAEQGQIAPTKHFCSIGEALGLE